MAQAIQIPFSFEFRTTKVQWAQADSRITGWARRNDGTVDAQNLVAKITSSGFSRPVRYPRQLLPEGIYDNLWIEAYTDKDVERSLSAYEPELFVPSGQAHAEGADFKKHSQPADASEMRKEFLSLKPNSKSVIAFLNKWGRWNFEEFVQLSEILRLQQSVREALISSPESWFSSRYSFPPPWRRSPEYPYFFFLTDRCEVAIRLTVTIDLLKQAKFRVCARADCGQPFPVETQHEKKYCDQYCGHLESLRRTRKTTAIQLKRSKKGH
jgi:hypothetical protein